MLPLSILFTPRLPEDSLYLVPNPRHQDSHVRQRKLTGFVSEPRCLCLPNSSTSLFVEIPKSVFSLQINIAGMAAISNVTV
ncbi:hypothetical protein RchiOBHm_Chr3g0481571 [Rosa chinensis]|uniref:Uncharacterized protein n=1 Tax=Rosa chinensis TaxID=74649 RepID=A0A2P6RDY9_ROSCH|nr:hypothetical protein RchiOBHm_Chr3g0481571 [Rosa chinensis]